MASEHGLPIVRACKVARLSRAAVISESLKVMKEHFGVPQAAVARELRVQPLLLQTLLEFPGGERLGNVVSLIGATKPHQ